MYRSQTGATLIVVLIVLLLITSVSIFAVRQSSTDLRIATNDQVETLLLNSADSAHSHLEQAVDSSGNVAEYNQLISASGVFGYFMNAAGEVNRGDQVVLCYNPRQDNLFRLTNASVLTPNGGSKIVGGSSANGYCNVKVSDDYTSARNTAMTQLMVTRPQSSNTPSKAFEGVTKGRDINADDPISSEPLFDIHASSVVPAMAKAEDDDMNDCFKKPSTQASRFKYYDQYDDGNDIQTPFDETLSGCMQQEGAPAKVVVEQVRMRNTKQTDICTDFGKNNSGDISQACQDKYNLDADGTPKSGDTSDDGGNNESGDDNG